MNAATQPKICLVEDDPIMGESLCDRFQLEGLAYDWYKSAASALGAIGRKPYAVVISDIRLPDMDGGDMFVQLRGGNAALPPFIFITGYGAIDRAVELLKLGAADYITKPFDLDQLIEKVRALAQRAARPSGPVLGVSQAMRRIEDMLPRLAKHASTLLICGESGVGKEHVAQALDRLARDSEKCPFVAVNCGAVTETLFEAELFGYERGAFTGAVRMKKGYFEQAHCGTLFLDEISELPPAMQVKLLRAIQERRIVRVGGEASIAVDFRLICATNRDLKEMVEHGLFREDLFYRVNVVQIKIPPLRERKEDILWFARMFLDEFGDKHGGVRYALTPRAEQALLEYPWPGNIRELHHAVERACIISAQPELGAEAFFGEGLTPWTPPAADGNLSAYLQECERKYIHQALVLHQGHIAHTAESLGISRKSLWEKMRKLGLASGSAKSQ
ncbi:MAG: sigma-54-dependent Fis family transcriptional regulator [Rhodocyclales bacterium]|nr:sigma-54-dependent Fis family transcriptional regulator [Rhodocyclales bacterium]